jgi:hypothetical protein
MESTAATCTCRCHSEQRALLLLEECANIVTDHHHRPFTTIDKIMPQKHAVVSLKTWSAISVRDVDAPNFPSSCLSPSPSWSSCDCCERLIDHHCRCRRHSDIQPDSFAFWRQQMFDWACVVVDQYGISDRSSVLALTFSLLDRYVAHEHQHDDYALHNNNNNRSSSNTTTITRDDFQLYGMTALYTIIKVTETTTTTGAHLSIAALVQMSLGFYSEQDVLSTEQEMFQTLSWRLHAPTPVTFARLFLMELVVWRRRPMATTRALLLVPLLGRGGPRQQQQQQQGNDWLEWEENMQRSCEYLTVLAIAEKSFVGIKASLVGLACIVLAARRDGTLSCRTIQQFMSYSLKNGRMDVADFQHVYRQLEEL